MEKLVIDSLGGYCPVQAEGTVDGKPFYFRARHDNWSFGVGYDPIKTSLGLAAGWTKEGQFENSGWMPKDEALEIIHQCAKEYLTEKANNSTAE